MAIEVPLHRCLPAAVILTASACLVTTARSQHVPQFMEEIAGRTASSPAEVATKNVLALNTSMFQLYGNASAIFQKNVLAKHPVILALFSGAGGRFLLYRPGMAPLEAAPVPRVYQLLKSVGHSTMALSEVVMPYLDNAADQSWRGPLLAYRSQMQSALDGLDATEIPADWLANTRTILQNNIALMDDCAKAGSYRAERCGRLPNTRDPFSRRTLLGPHRLRSGIGCGSLPSGRSSSVVPGIRPTRPATRFMSPDKTTSCSASWPSSSGRTQSTAG